MKKNKGFTLIELLAVIIILAIIALIATPVVIKVVDNAKESARKSSVSGYADAVKLAINEKMFENKGSSPTIDDTFLNSINYQGSTVTCNEVKNTNNYGVILKECTVATNSNLYCFAKGKVYNCDDAEFINAYNNMNENTGTPTVTVYNTIKGVNKPQLLSGMTPIKWVDGVETTTTVDDTDWYDYSNKLWANAKTQDGSYWVWIPRYAYKISTGWHTATAGTIDVIFLKNDTEENSSNTTIQTSGYTTTGANTSNAYFLEPAFQNETSNTKYGFWVAKFEASVSDTADACYTSASATNCDKTTLTPKFLPNVYSWRYITIGNQYTVAQNMASNASYGWNNADTHMMTNYEWGAVTYLSWSTYGKNSEVWINNSSTYTTGCAGNSVSEASYSGCQNAYNTSNGANASTTGNITGIYDMSGGSSEYVVAYVNNDNSNLTTYGNSIINSTINKNIYSKGESDDQATNYAANVNIYGDAVYETSGSYSGTGWNSDNSYMPYSSNPWFIRGGYCINASSSGLFSFRNPSGGAFSSIGFRAVTMSIQ